MIYYTVSLCNYRVGTLTEGFLERDWTYSIREKSGDKLPLSLSHYRSPSRKNRVLKSLANFQDLNAVAVTLRLLESGPPSLVCLAVFFFQLDWSGIRVGLGEAQLTWTYHWLGRT
jgi:hypothetical protein